MNTALNSLGQEATAGIGKSLDQKGLTLTGKTKASLRHEVSVEAFRTTLSIYGAANLGALQGGAKPIRQRTNGKFIESLTQWAKQRLGLDDKEAKGFAFAYLKKRTGTGQGSKTVRPDGTYFVPNPYNDGKVLSDTINPAFIKRAKAEATKAAAIDFRAEIALALKRKL